MSGLRFIVGVACGLFAALVGGMALLLSIMELIQGQAHGPSVVFMSALIAPFVIGAGAISWRILR
jgi:hypothetical protein